MSSANEETIRTEILEKIFLEATKDQKSFLHYVQKLKDDFDKISKGEQIEDHDNDSKQLEQPLEEELKAEGDDEGRLR